MVPTGTRSDAPRLILCGGGHAMLPSIRSARAWVEAGASVCLISEHRYLYYSGMVPEYLGGVYQTEEIRIDLEALCADVGIPFIEAQATALNAPARLLTTADNDRYPYDLLAFDVGARNPNVPGGALPTRPLHRLEHFAHLLERTLTAPAPPLRLVVVGGGAAGVEIALNVAERFARYGRAEALSLHLVEQKATVLPNFPRSMQAYVKKLLRRRGVSMRLDACVTDMTEDGLHFSQQPPLPADFVLWATGSVGPPLFRQARLPCNNQGFLRVNGALQCLADPRIFAAGDCAAVEGHEELARIGVHAVKQGVVLQENLTRALKMFAGDSTPTAASLKSFHPYPVAPLILSTGKPEGLWTTGGWWLHGRPLLRLKHFLDRRWIRRYAPEPWRAAGFLDLWDAAAANP